MTEISDQLAQELVGARNTIQAKAMEQYMRNKFSFLGIPSRQRKEICKKHYASLRKMSPAHRGGEILTIWEQGEREYQYCAIDMYIACKSKLVTSDMDTIIHLLSTKQWWDSIDLLASHLVGGLWRKHTDLRDQYFDKWLESDDIWLNRTCLIYQLKYKEDLDTCYMEKAIDGLIHKNEFFIQKAIGWILRQHSKIEPGYVEAFVKERSITGLAKREALKNILKNK